MKPAEFDYERVTTLDEALGALAGIENARVLAGGQSLIPLMAMREVRPTKVVDLRRVIQLDYIEARDDHVAIGAMTRHVTSETSSVLTELVPLVPMSVTRVAYPTVRNQGTAGGSLAHADFRSELPACAITLDACLILRSPGFERIVAADDFFLGHQQTAIRPGEILTEWQVPLEASQYTWAMDEFTPRWRDFAIIAAYAGIRLGQHGRIDGARLTIGASDPTPQRIRSAEELLLGESPSVALAEEVAALVPAALTPVSDRFGDASYRRSLAATYARRVLLRAMSLDATEETSHE